MELLIVWMLLGICAAVVGSNRGGSVIGWFVTGALLGPFGWALAFTAGKRCPTCANKINERALLCPHCRTNTEGGRTPMQFLPHDAAALRRVFLVLAGVSAVAGSVFIITTVRTNGDPDKAKNIEYVLPATYASSRASKSVTFTDLNGHAFTLPNGVRVEQLGIEGSTIKLKLLNASHFGQIAYCRNCVIATELDTAEEQNRREVQELMKRSKSR